MTRLRDCVLLPGFVPVVVVLAAGDCVLSYLVHVFLFPVEKIASKLETIRSSALDAPETRLSDAG